MMAERERDVAEAFVMVSGALATGHDVVDLLDSLTEVCTRLLDIDAAGLLLADAGGVLHVMAASSADTAHLESFQVQRDEGPCRDCFLTGAPVMVPDLEREQARWPQFAAAARVAGFASVHAVPLRLRDTTLGAMGLFATTVGVLNPDDLRLGQALADVASVALIQDKAVADRSVVVGQLQAALDSRVIIEQAKGVLAQQGGLDMDAAFAALRRYSRDHNLRLGAVAHNIVVRTLAAADVLTHAHAASRSGR